MWATWRIDCVCTTKSLLTEKALCSDRPFGISGRWGKSSRNPPKKDQHKTNILGHITYVDISKNVILGKAQCIFYMEAEIKAGNQDSKTYHQNRSFLGKRHDRWCLDWLRDVLKKTWGDRTA